MSLLELKNVTKRFGGLTAVEGLDLNVEEHQISALIGPNGAGKTTVFNMITGAYHVTEGTVTFDGVVINDEKQRNAMKPHKIVELGIARTFQNIRLFKKMSVLDNVMTGFHSVSKAGMFNIVVNPSGTQREERENQEKAMEILRFLNLQDIADSKAGDIPYGTQRLLEIGRALATKPKLLLLDEPAAGMNSSEKKELVKTIRRIRDEFNLAVLLVEHDMELVMDISEDITVINFGRPIAHGTAAEVQANEDVIEAYLGRSDD
jgi:branched-chain amino acid transport system ATP-binding protein